MRSLTVFAFALVLAQAQHDGLQKSGGTEVAEGQHDGVDFSPDRSETGAFDRRVIPEDAEKAPNTNNGRPNAVQPGTDYRYCVKVGMIVDQAMINLLGSEEATREYFDELLKRISPYYENEWSTRLRLATGFGDNGIQIHNSWKKNNGGDRLDELQGLYTRGKYKQDKSKANLVIHATAKELDGGGIAWMEGLFSYEYQFGVVLGMEGKFSKWDLMVMAHEIGHLFGADHTHELKPAIDKCANTCRGDIPRRCDPSKPLETSFCGSIMSYCHVCMTGPGDMDNVVFDFHKRNQDIVNKLFGNFDVNYSQSDVGTCDGDSIDTPDEPNNGGGDNNNGGNNDCTPDCSSACGGANNGCGGRCMDACSDGSGRVTTNGDECFKEWSMQGDLHRDHSCLNYCCNPDSDAGGEWCFVSNEGDWGYCAPAAGGGGGNNGGGDNNGGDGARDCPRPSPGGKPYCSKHEYKTLDCDGDGFMDHVCIGRTGQQGLILSSENCRKVWPNAVLSRNCPAALEEEEISCKSGKKKKKCNQIEGCEWQLAPTLGKKGGCVAEGSPKPTCPACGSLDSKKLCKKKLGKKVCKFDKKSGSCNVLKAGEYSDC